MSNKQLWYSSLLPKGVKHIPLSFCVPPKIIPDNSLAVLSTERYVTQNQSQVYEYPYAPTGLTIKEAYANIVSPGHTINSITEGSFNTSQGSLPIEDGKVIFKWLNSPIRLKGVEKTESGHFFSRISGGMIWRFHVVSELEPEFSWLIKAGLVPGDEVFLGYSVPEVFYNSSAISDPANTETSKLTTEYETVYPTSPTEIKYSQDLEILSSIFINGVETTINLLVGESSNLIREIDPISKTIKFKRSFSPDTKVTLKYKTYSEDYVYKGFRFVDEFNNSKWCTCDLSPVAGHHLYDQTADTLKNSSDALTEQVLIYLIPVCFCKLDFTNSGPADATILNGSLRFDTAFNYDESHFVRHYVGQTNEVFDASLGLDENFYNYWGITPFGKASFDEPGSGAFVEDIFSSFLPSMIPVGKILLSGAGASKSVSVLDLRPRGGGLPESFSITDARSRGKEYEIPNLWDMGNWPGKLKFTGGSVTIQIPKEVLDNYNEQEVEDICKFYVSPGTMYNVEYV